LPAPHGIHQIEEDEIMTVTVITAIINKRKEHEKCPMMMSDEGGKLTPN